jgi:TonB family protein
MKPASGHKNWLALLQKWWSADARRHDEQALEALAKSDPFLAEALEGYRSMPERNHGAAVTRLKADLRSKYQKKRKGAGFYAWRIAAIGAVLLAAWLLLQQFDQSNNAPAGIAETAVQPADTSALAPSTPVEPSDEGQWAAGQNEESLHDNTQRQETLSAQKDQGQAAPIAETKSVPVIPAKPDSEEARQFSNVQPAQEQELAANDATIPTEGRAAEVAAPAGAQAPPTAARKLNDDDLAISNKTKPGAVEAVRHISGKVTDGAGNPLIGANVLVEKTNLGAVTNVDGTYALAVPNQATTLLFSYTGYEDRQVVIGQSNSIDVQMTESLAALQEVAVLGLKKGKSEAGQAEPKGGFEKFEKYLAEKLQYPSAAAKAGVEGEVVTSFKVNKDGSLSEFRTVKPLGYGCDEEAIRLLREGPKWKAPAGTYATYGIFFKKK